MSSADCLGWVEDKETINVYDKLLIGGLSQEGTGVYYRFIAIIEPIVD